MFDRIKEKLTMDAPQPGNAGWVRVRMFLLAALLLLAVGVGAWGFLNGVFEDLPLPDFAAPGSPAGPGTMPADEAAPLKTADGAPEMNAHPPDPKVQQINRVESDGTGPVSFSSRETALALSELLSLKQLKQAQLAVKELDRKMMELDMPLLPPVGQPVGAFSAPTPVVSGDEATPTEEKGAALPRIRSIKGFGGKLRAVLVAGGAVKDVGTGDRFQNGRINSISLRGVEFTAQDGSAHTLSFED